MTGDKFLPQYHIITAPLIELMGPARDTKIGGNGAFVMLDTSPADDRGWKRWRNTRASLTIPTVLHS